MLECISIVDKCIDIPSVVIEGISSIEEVDFFRKNKVDRRKSLPLFCLINNTYKRIGFFEISLDSLISLKQIFGGYKVYIAKQDGMKRLDLESEATFLKMIGGV